MNRALTIAAAALALSLCACGGRPHIEEGVGESWGRVFQAQREAEPRTALASMGADEAKGIMANHAKAYHARAKGSASPGGRGGGASGQVSPLMGESVGGGSTSPIKLQAK